MPPASEDRRLQPFALGKAGPTVLLVHGFTGTPFEMRYLGGHLARRGFRALGVRLPGHGLDPYALERARASDWINEARAALFAQPPGERVFLAGMSMGALISLILAAEHPDRVAGLALCAPALRVRTAAALLLALSGLGALDRAIRFVKSRPSGVVDPLIRARMPRLAEVPTAAFAEFAKVQALARLALPRVRAPALVVYSRGDRTVPPRAARELKAGLGSRPVRMLELLRSSHVVTLDLERACVAQEVESFFKALL